MKDGNNKTDNCRASDQVNYVNIVRGKKDCQLVHKNYGQQFGQRKRLGNIALNTRLKNTDNS